MWWKKLDPAFLKTIKNETFKKTQNGNSHSATPVTELKTLYKLATVLR
jgi:hypothetical protein